MKHPFQLFTLGLITASLAGILGMVGGCALVQQTLPGLALSDANVIDVLNTIGEDEIDAAQLARQKARTPEVQAFAGRVLLEHEGLVEKNQRVAQSMDVYPKPPALAAALRQTHGQEMNRLEAKSGTDFDRAYIEYEIALHVQAFRLVENAAEEEGTSALKQLLVQTGPDLLSHLSAAKAVERHLVATLTPPADIFP